MTTGQATFIDFIKTYVAPGLRELGFSGSGNKYKLPNSRCFAILGIQKSAYSTTNEVKFTINLTVADKNDWLEQQRKKTYLPKEPAANTFYGDFVWQSRIGTLLPDSNDKWWSILPSSDLQQVSEEVLEAIKKYALPAIVEKLG